MVLIERIRFSAIVGSSPNIPEHDHHRNHNHSTMASIRPISRPTIRELSKYLLSPQAPSRNPRCLSNASRQTRYPTHHQAFTTISPSLAAPKNRSRDRGPASTEDTQTDFGALDVLGATPQPSTSIDACLWDGFHLNSGVKITGGKGVILVAGEAFSWKPWLGDGKGLFKMVNEKGQWEVDDSVWGVLEMVWPKPGAFPSSNFLHTMEYGY